MKSENFVKEGYGCIFLYHILHGMRLRTPVPYPKKRTDTVRNPDSYGINTEDRVFLLSEEELVWFGEADISIYAVPTEAAVTQDKTKWYEAYSLSFGLEEYIWLLRDPWEDSASACKAVSNGYGGEKLISVEAGAEGFGIRPAICVDCRALSELLGSENR